MSKLRTVQNGDSIAYAFFCPGCGFYHILDKRWKVKDPESDTPTATPSLLNRYPRHGKNEKRRDERCHLFVRQGKIQYLADCSHELAGQTVDMQEED